MTKQLPYFSVKNTFEKEIEGDLVKILKKRIKKKLSDIPQHYIIQPKKDEYIKYIQEHSKKYPCFLKFDIKLYYPSIDHIVLKRFFKKEFKEKKYSKTLKQFLEKSPYGKGIPINSGLSFFLSAFFLTELDLKIQNPFLRYVDDYLILFKKQNEPKKFLKEVVYPTLKELNLEINEKKLSSGKLKKDRVTFLGFDYISNYVLINDEKVLRFKKRIRSITGVNRKKNEKEIIKVLNNQIVGFGHFYKFSSCKKIFSKLDSFTRMRFRRYISRDDSKNSNFSLNNDVLHSLGLKSLLDIKNVFDGKNILKKKRVLDRERSVLNLKKDFSSLAYSEIKFQNILIIQEIKKLNFRLDRIEKKIKK